MGENDVLCGASLVVIVAGASTVQAVESHITDTMTGDTGKLTGKTSLSSAAFAAVAVAALLVGLMRLPRGPPLSLLTLTATMMALRTLNSERIAQVAI
jgi:hypothetical protein